LKRQHIIFHFVVLPFQGAIWCFLHFFTQGVAVGLGYVRLSAFCGNDWISCGCPKIFCFYFAD